MGPFLKPSWCQTLFVLLVPFNDSSTLEALGCNEALSLAADCKVTSICVGSDCLEVVRNIKEMPKSKYYAILKEIDVRRRSFANVVFRRRTPGL